MKKHDKLIFLLFFYFLLQILYFTFFIIHITPDYARHLFISELYYQKPLQFPFEDKAEYFHILIETPATPYLYHLLMGWLLNLNFFNLNPYLYLGFINALLSIPTFYFAYKFVNEVSDDKFVQICALMILTNTVMYVFIFSGVSYDNLVNLCAMASFYYFISYLKNYIRFNLLALMFFCCVGTLTKFTFLPLMFFYLIILLWESVNIYRQRDNLKNRLQPFEIILLTFCVVLLSLNIRHYGGNIVSYGKILPGTEDVRGDSEVRDPVHKRDKKLIESADERVQLSFPKYLISWLYISVKSIISVTSHKSVSHSDFIVKTFCVIFVLSFIVLIARYPYWCKNKIDFYVLLICIAYAVIVIYTNYKSYSRHYALGVGLQGRYLFPIYFPFVAMLIKYNFSGLNDKIKYYVCITLTVVFISLGTIFFFAAAPDLWYKTLW